MEKIGTKRKYSFTENIIEIKEIIKYPPVKVPITMNGAICSRCKHQNSYTITFEFEYVEILHENKKDIALKDIILIGYSANNKTIKIPDEYKLEILKYSENYKEVK